MPQPQATTLIYQIKGGEVLLDAADLALISTRKWYVSDNKRGHRYAVADKRKVSMHRLLMGLEHGDGRLVDHINRQTLDNRRSNLRIVTHSENCRNRRPSTKGLPTGIMRYRDGYMVKLYRKYVGVYETLEQAQSALDAAKVVGGTPRTDANLSFGFPEHVKATFCRMLERENAKLRAALDPIAKRGEISSEIIKNAWAALEG